MIVNMFEFDGKREEATTMSRDPETGCIYLVKQKVDHIYVLNLLDNTYIGSSVAKTRSVKRERQIQVTPRLLQIEGTGVTVSIQVLPAMAQLLR